MPGAGRQADDRAAGGARRFHHDFDEARVAGGGPAQVVGLEADTGVVPGGEFPTDFLQFPVERLDGLHAEVADLETEFHFPRDHIRRARMRFDPADGGDLPAGERPRLVVHRGDEAAGGDQGVPADRHRGRPGVVREPGDRDPEPADPHDPFHGADLVAAGVEHRALLDMEFQEAGGRPGLAFHFGEPLGRTADPPERRAERDPAVERQVEFLGGDFAGEGAAAGLPVLLVEEDEELERVAEFRARFVERLHRFEAGDAARGAVVVAAVRHGVEVRAEEQRRKRRLPSRPEPPQVAREVGFHPEPGAPEPAGEPFARRQVGVAPAGPGIPARGVGADSGEFLHPPPDPVLAHRLPAAGRRRRGAGERRGGEQAGVELAPGERSHGAVSGAPRRKGVPATGATASRSA